MADERRTARIYIDDKDAQAALKRLQAEATHLRKRLEEVPHGSKEFQQIERRLVQVDRNMKSLQRTANDTKNAFGSLGKLAGGFALGTIVASAAQTAMRAVGDFVAGSVDAYRTQQKAEQALLVALKGRKDVQDALLAQATALQGQTNFGDEQIIQAQALAATMGLTREQIEQLIPVALDLSAATGMSLDGAVKNLSRTFGGLTGELGEQMPMLRNLTQEQLKAGEAIKVVGEAVRGQAQAAAEADGHSQQLSNVWGDLQEKVGELFNEMFDLNEGNSALVEGIGYLITQTERLIVKVKQARDFFGEWYQESETFRAAVQALGISVKLVGTLVLAGLENVIIRPIKGMIAAVKAARLAMQGDFSGAGDVLVGFGNEVRESLTETGNDIKDIFTNAFKEVVSPAPRQAAKKAGEALGNDLANGVGTGVDKAAAKALESLRTQLQKLREQLTVAGNTDEDAKELAALQLKYDKLAQAAKGHAEERLEVERLYALELEQLTEKQYARRRDQLAKLEADMDKARTEARNAGLELEAERMELETANLEETELMKAERLLAIELAMFDQRVAALQEKREEEEQAAKERFELRMEEAQGNKDLELEAEQLYQDELNNIRQEAANEELKLQQEKNQRFIQAEEQRRAAMYQLARSTAQALGSLFELAAADEAEALGFRKAAAIFQIAIDTAQAISGVTRAAATTSLTPLDMAVKIAAGTATVLANIAQAKQLLEADPPSAPRFAAGGDTFRDGGNVGRPTLAWVGERGPEYVAPNWMYMHPALQSTFSMLEAIRRQGYIDAYAAGGPVKGTALVNARGPGGGDSEMAQAIMELNRILGRGITATQNYDLQREFEDRLLNLEEQANVRA